MNMRLTKFFLFVTSLVTLLLVGRIQASELCAPRFKESECYTIRNREESLVSVDNRGVTYKGQPCVWCIKEGACPNGNVCEPKKVLDQRGKVNGIDFESCLEVPVETCDLKANTLVVEGSIKVTCAG